MLHPQTDSPEMQPVGVLAEPVPQILLSFPSSGIANRPARGLIFLQDQVLSGLAWKGGEAVPAPLRLGAQWNPRFVGCGECLCPGHICCKRDFTVTETERPQRINGRDHWVVPTDELLTVDGATGTKGGDG